MRVLVADDEPVSRRLLESTLRRWGYDVVVASDGFSMGAAGHLSRRAATARANRRPPSLSGTKASPGLVQNWPAPIVIDAASPSAIASARFSSAAADTKTGFTLPISA